jgi:hypothetical protein
LKLKEVRKEERGVRKGKVSRKKEKRKEEGIGRKEREEERRR